MRTSEGLIRVLGHGHHHAPPPPKYGIFKHISREMRTQILFTSNDKDKGPVSASFHSQFCGNEDYRSGLGPFDGSIWEMSVNMSRSSRLGRPFLPGPF